MTLKATLPRHAPVNASYRQSAAQRVPAAPVAYWIPARRRTRFSGRFCSSNRHSHQPPSRPPSPLPRAAWRHHDYLRIHVRRPMPLRPPHPVAAPRAPAPHALLRFPLAMAPELRHPLPDTGLLPAAAVQRAMVPALRRSAIRSTRHHSPLPAGVEPMSDDHELTDLEKLRIGGYMAHPPHDDPRS